MSAAPAAESGQWLSMAEAARRVGEERTRFRRRMELLNERHGGDLLRQVGRGKKRNHQEVHSKALLHYQRVDLEFRDQEMAQMRAELDETNRKLEALRNSFLAFRRKSLVWFQKHSAQGTQGT